MRQNYGKISQNLQAIFDIDRINILIKTFGKEAIEPSDTFVIWVLCRETLGNFLQHFIR